MIDPRTDRIRGCLLGLAVGDAVGTTVEFRPRGSFEPVIDMTGGGPFHLAPGQWTDDTSMALCLAESLVACQGFNARDQMERYVRWWREGYLSSTGVCFDIGFTTSAALARFAETAEPLAGDESPRSAGNGSLMRLAPVPMFFADEIEQAVHFAGESSRTTHAAQTCVDACRLYARMLCIALAGDPKEAILEAGRSGRLDLAPEVDAIAEGRYRRKEIDAIRGSGYVVESLEAALWCFDRTDTFRDAILTAVNLGDDTDTTAAVCGQVAGAFYGEQGIPPEWLGRLCMRDRITELADALMKK